MSHLREFFGRDRIGRIMAHEQRATVRVARRFEDPDCALAQEVRDILAASAARVWTRERPISPERNGAS